MTAQPHDGHDSAAHEHDHNGHERDHEAEGPLGGVAQRITADAEFLLFLVLPDKGFYHPHGVQVLLHHQVHVVGGALQRREKRADVADDDDHRDDQQRDDHQEYLAQVQADLHGLDEGRDQHHRGADTHPHPHEQRHLHGGDVVGQPGDEAGSGEMLDVGKREPLHLLVLRLAQVRAEAHGRLGGQSRCAHAAQQRRDGHEEHLQPRQQDVAPVAAGDAHVHDLTHSLGQLQLQHGLAHGAQHAQQNKQSIALGIPGQLFQHGSISSSRLRATRSRKLSSCCFSSSVKFRSKRWFTCRTTAVNLS